MTPEDASRQAIQATIADIRYLLDSWPRRSIPVATVRGWAQDFARLHGLEPVMPDGDRTVTSE